MSEEIIIQAEQLGKRYTLGGQPGERYSTLRDLLARSAGRLMQRKPSLEKIGPSDFWALRDVSFEIKRGEVVGIIGRNGAGKSTLLKVLSRITEPTSGRVVIRGRVASLLEVGTGFHPELTGRENIYLNGAILGMGRAEIKAKFDEIVAFAEVEKFLDTPVKRYSSGMYVRLAFAVAAHLEPEILIVDEVLAVGDIEFQRKCLGKMDAVAKKEGRTVLFVSHNMPVVAQLTQSCVLLAHGQTKAQGKTTDIVQIYLRSSDGSDNPAASYQAHSSSPPNHLVGMRVATSDGGGIHHFGAAITFHLTFKIAVHDPTICFSIQLLNQNQQPVCHFWHFNADSPLRRGPGMYALSCSINSLKAAIGDYTVTTWLSSRRSNEMFENLQGICPFSVVMDAHERQDYEWRAGDCAYYESFRWSEPIGPLESFP